MVKIGEQKGNPKPTASLQCLTVVKRLVLSFSSKIADFFGQKSPKKNIPKFPKPPKQQKKRFQLKTKVAQQSPEPIRSYSGIDLTNRPQTLMFSALF